MEVICNVCYQPITNPAEHRDRIYRMKKGGKVLPSQKKHDQCAAAYEAEKTGLEKVEG